MTETAKPVTPAGRVWRGRLDETEEGRRLLANPRFRELVGDARRSGTGLALDEFNRRAGITGEEWAAADAEIDRLLAEQVPADSAGAADGKEVDARP